MESYENLWNTVKVFKGQEASLETNKVFYKAAGRVLRVVPGFEDPCLVFRESLVIHANLYKIMKNYENPKIYENLYKSVKYDESPQRTRSQPGIEHKVL